MRRQPGTAQGKRVWTPIAGAMGAALLITAAVCAIAVIAAPNMVALGLREGPVYSVSHLRDELAVRPGAWRGRTVRIYAVATHIPVRYCPYPGGACVGESPVLADASDAGTRRRAHLPLVWGLSDPLRALLRRIPLIARVVPSQAPRWGRPATYRVTLGLLPGPGGQVSYAAVLLDASPVAGL